jgi:hypothetical protein
MLMRSRSGVIPVTIGEEPAGAMRGLVWSRAGARIATKRHFEEVTIGVWPTSCSSA